MMRIRRSFIAILIAVLLCFFASACTLFENLGGKEIKFDDLREVYYLYTGDYTDLNGEIFAYVCGIYGYKASSISVGTLLVSDKIYITENNVAISHVAYAGDKKLVWTEFDQDGNASLKLYDIKTAEIIELDSFKCDAMTPFYMGTYNNSVYYLILSEEYAKILSVNIKSGTKSEILSESMPDSGDIDDFPIYNLAVNDHYLVYVTQADHILSVNTMDLDTGETAKQALPSTVNITFNIAYSASAKSSFIYYADYDSGKDFLSVFNGSELSTIEELPKNYYLYHDILSLNGDYLCYNIQKRVSGEIKDHYSGRIYNIKTAKKSAQPKYSFFTAVYNENRYNVCFTEKGTTSVYLRIHQG